MLHRRRFCAASTELFGDKPSHIYNSLKNAYLNTTLTTDNKILEFESFYRLSGADSKFDCLMISSSYIKIYEQLDYFMKTGNQNYNFICTGHTGLGKSMFVYFIIYRLLVDKESFLYQKNKEERKILFQCEQGTIVHIAKDGDHEYHKLVKNKTNKYRELLADRNAIIFADMRGPHEPDLFAGTTILFCPDDFSRYHEFTKTPTIRWMLNMLTDEEMSILQDRKYNHLDKNEVKNRQRYYNNNPLHVFEGYCGIKTILLYPYSNREDLRVFSNSVKYNYVSDEVKNSLNQEEFDTLNKEILAYNSKDIEKTNYEFDRFVN